MTNIETKALCALFRQAEEEGYRTLVEKMISLCDKQSGLRFEELWDWWNSHKDGDKSKEDSFDKALETLRQNLAPITPNIFPPIYPNWITPSKNQYEIIC